MAMVSVPRGGRGMSRLASLSCQRAASTDGLARKTGFATMRKPIRTTRATRLNGVDRAGVNAAVEPWDIGHVPVGSSLTNSAYADFAVVWKGRSGMARHVNPQECS